MVKNRRRQQTKKRSKNHKKRNRSHRYLRGGSTDATQYAPPPMKVQFTSANEAQQNAVAKQNVRGTMAQEFSKQMGGFTVPKPGGISKSGQDNLRKLAIANADAVEGGRYDKLGGGRRRRRRRKTRRRKKKSARKQRRRRRRRKSKKKR